MTREEVPGQDGPVKQLTGRLLQRVLEAGMDGHPGCRKRGNAGDNSGDSRNGCSGKTVLTESQETAAPILRDRRGPPRRSSCRTIKNEYPGLTAGLSRGIPWG
ncbi:MAG: transposase [Spirochaetaceae bacterium]|nr:transposase [Spirochaetaceae bacterium]